MASKNAAEIVVAVTLADRLEVLKTREGLRRVRHGGRRNQHDGRMADRKPEPDRDRPFPVVEQFARGTLSMAAM